ncbi:MAG: helix-turn-helix domain-containing protein [Pseudomonadota bacterium]
MWFARIVDEWLQSRPAPLVSALVAGSRLSLRQLERKCNALYGKSPKVLAREARALRAASEIALNPHAGYDVVEFGFYDQAHMIREIKHFTGTTPGRIRAATWGSAVGLAALSDQTPSLATVSAKYVP